MMILVFYRHIHSVAINDVHKNEWISHFRTVISSETLFAQFLDRKTAVLFRFGS